MVQSGIKPIDEACRFNLGSIVSVCSFAGEGKSTLLKSMLFVNALKGSKCLFISSEDQPEVLLDQLQSRYSHEISHDSVCEFNVNLSANVTFCSAVDVPFSHGVNALTKWFEGYDMVFIDNLTTICHSFPDGNSIIASVALAVQKLGCVCVNAVSTTRGGWKHAIRYGRYDFNSICDFTEVERISSQIIFMLTDADDLILQQTRLTLLKNRSGYCIIKPFRVGFNPAIVTVGADVKSIGLSDDEVNQLADFDFGRDDL